jgi:signal transduction histidine kinase
MLAVFGGIVVVQVQFFLVFQRRFSHLIYAAVAVVWAVHYACLADDSVFAALGLSDQAIARTDAGCGPILILGTTIGIAEAFPKVFQLPAKVAVGSCSGAAFVVGVALGTAVESIMAVCYVILVIGILWYLFMRVKALRIIPDTEQTFVLVGVIVPLVVVIADVMFGGLHPSRWLHGPTADAVVLFMMMCLGAASFEGSRRAQAAAVRQRDESIRAKEDAEREAALRAQLWNLVIHEVRTPLSVLSTHAEAVALSLHRQGVSPQQAEDLEVITDEVANLDKLIAKSKDLSAFSAASEEAEASVDAVLEHVSRIVSAKLGMRNIELGISIPQPLPQIAVSEVKLEHVLLNLLVNAANHTENGAITISAQQMGDMVEVVVADTGSGITPDDLAMVFEEGFTTTQHGSGLGLPVSQRIVQEAGGQIRMDSVPGRGTEVHFTVPVIFADRMRNTVEATAKSWIAEGQS